MATEELPTPKSRKETYLGKAAGMDIKELPTPASREELYLNAIAEGGGGGGTSYTAGEGIEITDNTISVDTDTIQEKLTAGTGIDITDNTISASGGDTVKVLTSADYNYHKTGDTDDGVAIWKLEPGLYDSAGVKIYIATDVSTTSRFSLYVCAKASDAVGIFMSVPFVSGPSWQFKMYRPDTGQKVIDGYFINSSNLANSTGTETNKVMTQNATTSMVYADPADKEKIQIGKSSASNGTKSIAIGSEANVGTSKTQAIAIGSEANAAGLYSVAIGSHATTSQTGEFNIGCGNATLGYNNSTYRLLTGLYDPQSAHDAATKGYVDAHAGGGATTLTSDDYNYPENSPDGIALWLLSDGDYQIGADAFLKVYIGVQYSGGPETTENWISNKFTIYGNDISYEQYTYVRLLKSGFSISSHRFESIGAFSIRKSDYVYNRAPSQGALIPINDIVSMATINNADVTADSYLVTGADVGKSLHKRLVIGLTAAPDNTTVGIVGTLATSIESGTPHVYMCTAVSGSTKTWTQLI